MSRRLAVGRWCVGLVLAICAAAPAHARRDGAASYDDTPLLKSRFLAAVYAARRPESTDHAESLVDILRAIEADYKLNLQTGELVATLVQGAPELKKKFEAKASPGIASYRPIERATEAPREAERGFLVDAINLSGLCVPAEAAYNLRYVDFLEHRRWPAERYNYAPVRYALYLRMYKRGCLPEKAFLTTTKPLVEPVKKVMEAATRPGDAGGYMYLLAASRRLGEVPPSLLRRFVESQERSGTWVGTEVGDPAVAAAQGAYVIAAMLEQRRGLVTQLELYHAEGGIPALPAPGVF